MSLRKIPVTVFDCKAVGCKFQLGEECWILECGETVCHRHVSETRATVCPVCSRQHTVMPQINRAFGEIVAELRKQTTEDRDFVEIEQLHATLCRRIREAEELCNRSQALAITDQIDEIVNQIDVQRETEIDKVDRHYAPMISALNNLQAECLAAVPSKQLVFDLQPYKDLAALVEPTLSAVTLARLEGAEKLLTDGLHRLGNTLAVTRNRLLLGHMPKFTLVEDNVVFAGSFTDQVCDNASDTKSFGNILPHDAMAKLEQLTGLRLLTSHHRMLFSLKRDGVKVFAKLCGLPANGTLQYSDCYNTLTLFKTISKIVGKYRFLPLSGPDVHRNPDKDSFLFELDGQDGFKISVYPWQRFVDTCHNCLFETSGEDLRLLHTSYGNINTSPIEYRSKLHEYKTSFAPTTAISGENCQLVDVEIIQLFASHHQVAQGKRCTSVSGFAAGQSANM